jgi:hypothetical protein
MTYRDLQNRPRDCKPDLEIISSLKTGVRPEAAQKEKQNEPEERRPPGSYVTHRIKNALDEIQMNLLPGSAVGFQSKNPPPLRNRKNNTPPQRPRGLVRLRTIHSSVLRAAALI